jgi:hypothetical protein
VILSIPCPHPKHSPYVTGWTTGGVRHFSLLHPASYPVCTVSPSMGTKRPVRDAVLSHLSKDEVIRAVVPPRPHTPSWCGVSLSPATTLPRPYSSVCAPGHSVGRCWAGPENRRLPQIPSSRGNQSRAPDLGRSAHGFYQGNKQTLRDVFTLE